MKTFFEKWRDSAALDAGRPIPTRLREKTSGRDEVHQFAEKTAALDGELKKSVPEIEDSTFLHASIMHAVRQAERGDAQSKVGLRWCRPASAVATVVLLGMMGWHLKFSKPVPESQIVAQSL